MYISDELKKLAKEGYGVYVDKETMVRDLVLRAKNCFCAFVKNDPNIMRDEFFEVVHDKECSKEMYVDNYDKAQDDNMKQVAMKYSAAKHLLRLSPCRTQSESK